MSVRFDHLSRETLDYELSPSLTAKDAGGVLARHKEMTKAALASPKHNVMCDVVYGEGEAERFDLIRPKGNGKFPCLIFIHGGFWQEGSKNGSGFAAEALAEHGWSTTLVGYTLAPKARLTEILQEIVRAVLYITDHADELQIDPAKIVLSGHSAGAHLAAAILAGKGGIEAARSLNGAILISGVFDLAPIAASYVNDAVGMDAAEISELSLLNARPLHDVPVHLIIGGDETQGFLCQTEALLTAWKQHSNQISRYTAKGRDHFDILDTMADTASPAFAILQEINS